MEKLKKLTTKENASVYSSSKNLLEENSSATDHLESYTNDEIDIESANEPSHSISRNKLKSELTSKKNKEDIQSETSSQSEFISKNESQSLLKKRKSKRRKKKRRNNSTDDKIIIKNENEELKIEYETEDTSDDGKDDTKEVISISDEKKKRHSKDKQSLINEVVEQPNQYILIGLHVSRCNLLRNDLFLYGPFVNIYIVNKTTGECYNSESNPLMTKHFEFHKKRSMVPHWNETIIFDKTLIEKLDDLYNVIMLFVIIDKTTNSKNEAIDKAIAWAFIKPIGFKDNSNMNKKLKLQLYSFNHDVADITFLKVYQNWKSGSFDIYPSALYVEIICVRADKIENDINNIKFNIMQNSNMKSKRDEKKMVSIERSVKEGFKFEKRTSKDQCELPNKIFKKINNAVFTMLKFSKCGNFLACSAKEQNKFIIVIYKVPECNIVSQLQHHQNLIYDICWNISGNFILTASSDCIVYLWNLTNTQSVTKQKFAHPAFAYTAKFCNFNEEIIATGCYDKLVRIWVADSSSKYVLFEELEGHTGTVNSICFMENIEMFFSGDSNGNIFKWAKGKSNWMKILNITIEEFKSSIINDLIIFPDGQRILVILRNHNPWTLNIATATKSICYKGGYPIKYQTRGVITSCGSMIFVGNNVWSASTGELIAVYNPVEYDHHCIMSCDFHPHFNILALSSGCDNSSIFLCTHSNEDSALGLEYYASGKFLKAPIDHNNKNTFKTISRNVYAEIVEEKNRNNEFKLWGLIKKMDGILLSVKRNRYNFKTQAKNLTEDLIPMTKLHISNEKEKSNSESQKIKNLNDAHRGIDNINFNGEISENSQLSNTYTLKKEEKSDVKHWNYRLDNIQHEIEESSTLSNAESLEEDSNTYTIFLNK